ncbi:hypothetical protein B0H13DRAFT_2031540 [Mycena leptocephala]|nr:hypothetical protein B0H13DRAFT_2031526 [Mycena leptocephala]KAJ7898786.1 hypothetical protein B0H13DRAFT_2031540 [Mycena leptocephala]
MQETHNITSTTPDIHSLETATPVKRLWNPHGNLIIHAGPVVCRVSREMLVEQSRVLREDMLDQSKLSTLRVFEGCPVLEFPHGSAETVHFLEAIFEPNSFAGPASFESIAAVLRLSSEYEVSRLKSKALLHLSSIYPTSFAEFCSESWVPPPSDSIIPAIQLAREHSVDWILPVAFYLFCAEMTAKRLLFGVEYRGEKMVLCLNDIGLCYDAERQIRTPEAYQRYISFFLGAGCTAGIDCERSRGVVLTEFFADLGVLPQGAAWRPDLNLCSTCRSDMEQTRADHARSMWEKLPGVFGLPDWTVLNDMKDVALKDPYTPQLFITYTAA